MNIKTIKRFVKRCIVLSVAIGLIASLFSLLTPEQSKAASTATYVYEIVAPKDYGIHLEEGKVLGRNQNDYRDILDFDESGNGKKLVIGDIVKVKMGKGDEVVSVKKIGHQKEVETDTYTIVEPEKYTIKLDSRYMLGRSDDGKFIVLDFIGNTSLGDEFKVTTKNDDEILSIKKLSKQNNL